MAILNSNILPDQWPNLLVVLLFKHGLRAGDTLEISDDDIRAARDSGLTLGTLDKEDSLVLQLFDPKQVHEKVDEGARVHLHGKPPYDGRN